MKLATFSSVLVLALTLMIFPQAKVSADEAYEKRAIAAADGWLKLVDNGKYAESWESASELFKAGMEKDQWSTAAAAVRRPLGKVLQRKLKSKQFTSSLPGAPDGKYVVIQYDMSFENKGRHRDSRTFAR